jgi:sugar fermentation stimulation protein A
MMKFKPSLQPATLLRRYKRFLADIELPTGERVTIHCPNTGSMKNCIVENSPCWYSISDNPNRKYPYTWEIATVPNGYLAGINTGRANALVEEAINNGLVAELSGYKHIKREVKYGAENSRIDFLLSDEKRADCYVEVKSVTLAFENCQGFFPDAVSTRGTKHLRELMGMVDAGHRAVLFFCVQHTGIISVAPADDIDPVYAATLREANNRGVEVLAYQAEISAEEIVLTKAIPVLLST